MKNKQRGILGDLIREKRTELGISQAELAKRLNITQGQVGKIERGEVGLSIERLSELSVVLETSIIELIVDSNYDTITENIQDKYQFNPNYVKGHQAKYYKKEVNQLREENLLLKKDTDAQNQLLDSLKKRILHREGLIERIRAHVVLGESLPEYKDVLQSYSKQVFSDYTYHHDMVKKTQTPEQLEEFNNIIINKIFNLFLQDMLQGPFSELDTDSGLEQTIYLHFRENENAFTEMAEEFMDEINLLRESQKEEAKKSEKNNN